MTANARPGAPRFVAADAHHVDVSVVLVSFNTAPLLPGCIGDLRAASAGLRVQVVVVDNASSDGSVELLRSAPFADVELIVSPVNIGFGRANNLALPRCRGRTILLLNTDAFVAPDAIARALRHLDAQADVGIVGARLSGRDGQPQPACRGFPTPLNTFLMLTGLERFAPRVRLIDPPRLQPEAPTACDWVPGCFMLLRREVVDRVGLFDPRFFLYAEEVDLCRRVKAAGWKVVYLPDAHVVHWGGESARVLGPLARASRQVSALQLESEWLYFRKHHGAAGALAWLALSLAMAALLSGKDLLRRRGAAVAGAHWRHALAIWSTARATGFGSRPTR